MAAYIAVRAGASAGRQVFGTDALVIVTADSGVSDVVAVAPTLAEAQTIADALNGA